MTITNPDAIGSFTPGQAYWLDISPVEAAPAARDFADPVNEAKAAGMRTSLGLNTLTTQDGTTIVSDPAPQPDAAAPSAPAADPAPAAAA